MKLIKCAVHHVDIGMCGCDADEQYRQAQSRVPAADPHAGFKARIEADLIALKASVERAKQAGVDLMHLKPVVDDIAASIGS